MFEKVVQIAPFLRHSKSAEQARDADLKFSYEVQAHIKQPNPRSSYPIHSTTKNYLKIMSVTSEEWQAFCSALGLCHTAKKPKEIQRQMNLASTTDNELGQQVQRDPAGTSRSISGMTTPHYF